MTLNEYPGTDPFITFDIEGLNLRGTNYYSHPYCYKGLMAMCGGEGAAHLLVPPKTMSGTSSAALIAELKNVDHVVVSIEKGGQRRVDLLFEDHSENPFSIQLAACQCVPNMSEEDDGTTDLRLRIYVDSTLAIVRDYPLRVRFVDEYPCHRAWDDLIDAKGKSPANFYEVNSDLCIKCLKAAKAYVCGGGRGFANFVEMMHAVLTADEWCNSKAFVRYAWDSVSAHFRLDLQEVNRDLLDEIYAKLEEQ